MVERPGKGFSMGELAGASISCNACSHGFDESELVVGVETVIPVE
jgi:hypothetical protein